jgi:hypothetical protein
MKRIKLIAVSLVASLMAGMVYADDVIVTDQITESNVTIDGDLIVKAGGFPVLYGVRIKGDLIL